MNRPFALLALSTVAAIAIVAAPQAAFAAEVSDDSSVTVTYDENDGVIANPQRGFYHHTETHYRADGSGYEPLDGATLAGYRDEGTTQILRVFYLEKFTASPTLDAEWLALVQADYDTARAAGISVISRFAYVQGGDFPYLPPYGDAPLNIVLSHIAQLGPILRANADVIPVVQNGLIGLWGEGYYTDYFVADPADPGVVTPQDWANRSAVTEALLAELPADRGVQVRTMAMKQQLLGVPAGAESAVTADEAYTDSAIARVGHHNDCLLAAPDDWGTFLSDPIELDQQYLEADSLYVPVGGETCNVNPPRSEWPSASAELARYHYSYLNRDYNEDVLDSWGAAGLTETAQRLGYRFVLESSTVTRQADGTARVSVVVRNDGWAAPYTPRNATLRLSGATGTTDLAFDAGSDARTWLPGTTTTLTATLGASLGTGSYTLGLALPSDDAGTSNDPRFAIQTANTGTWDAATGVNLLGQTVALGSPASPTLAATGVGDASWLAAALALLALLVGGTLLRKRRREG
jgi:LPXTG-motif cell wall-anchored protein